MTFGEQVVDFYLHLQEPENLPPGVELLNPFLSKDVQKIVQEFYRKFYSDSQPRTFLIGINPGRFGAGITGLPFTDPVRLEEIVGIKNQFNKRAELSSMYIYDLIHAFGGVKKFYSTFYITSVCPLGFVQGGKNLNYYDRKDLEQQLEHYILNTFKQQLKMGANRKVAFSLGKGKNMKYLQKLNEKHRLFDRIEPLPHPRWVMQYRLKKKEQIIHEVVEELNGFGE